MQRKISLRSGIKNKKRPKWLKILYLIASLIFIVFGVIELITNKSWRGIIFLLFGISFVLNALFETKDEYLVFENDGIFYPSKTLFSSKQNFLSYKNITEAKYILDDFVFRNKEQEIRLAKEFLNEKDVNFLQQKLAELNAIN